RDALLQLLLRFLVEDDARGSFRSAVEIFGNVAKVVPRVDNGAGAIVALAKTLSEIRDAPDWINDAVRDHNPSYEAGAQPQHDREEHVAVQATQVRDACSSVGALSSVKRGQHYPEQSRHVEPYQHPHGRIQTTLHNSSKSQLPRRKSQITGTGNASVNLFKSKPKSSRSCWRTIPQQWGTSRGASSTSKGSAVL